MMGEKLAYPRLSKFLLYPEAGESHDGEEEGRRGYMTEYL